MKIEMEIKEGKVIYGFKIGDSSHDGTSNLSAEYLMAFTGMLKLLEDSWTASFEKQKEVDLRRSFCKFHEPSVSPSSGN